MKAIPTAIADVLVIEPRVFEDERGFFFESFNQRNFDALVGGSVSFVQDNHSRSVKGVLRGLHYQLEQPQGKLVRVISGEVLDVAVDLRRSSPTFGQSVSCHLSAQNKRMLWIPVGFAHGFITLSDTAEFLYKTTDYWKAGDEHCVIWNDPALAIDWPDLGVPPQLSAKDLAGLPLAQCPTFP
jgi:dTDP-4-dehydrorhamnose 3,5-epimerase